MRMVRLALISLFLAGSSLLSSPSLASAEDNPPVTIDMLSVSLGDYAPNATNMYNCKASRPWKDVQLGTTWSVNDPKASSFASSQAYVFRASGQFEVYQGSKLLGNVRFSSLDLYYFKLGSPLKVSLVKSDLCALRKSGLGGPRTNFRLKLKSATAQARVTHFSTVDGSTTKVDDYDAMANVGGNPSAIMSVPQATSMTRISIKNSGKKYTFTSRLKVQDSRGVMRKGPKNVRITFSELLHGTELHTFGEAKTTSGGKITFTKRINHRHHTGKSYIGASTDIPLRSKIAQWDSGESDGTRIRW